MNTAPSARSPLEDLEFHPSPENSVGVELELDAFEDLVSLSVDDPDHSCFPIGHINSIDILTISHGMRLFDSANSLKYFSVPIIKHEKSMIILWSGEEPVTFEIDPEVVESALNLRGQLERLDQRQRLPLVRRSTNGEQN